MRGTYLYLLVALWGGSTWSTQAQIHWNQTYPLLSNTEISTLFTTETPQQLVVTGCLEEEWTTLKIDAATGSLQTTTPSSSTNCNSIQLTDGQTLIFEQIGENYQFQQYRGSNLVWSITVADIAIALTAQDVIAHPNGGFYICQSYPATLARYNSNGQLIYRKDLSLPIGYAAQINQVISNGDLYLRFGHLGNNNRGVTIAKINGNNGTYIWEADIESAEKITLDTRIAAHTNYDAIAVTNLFVENGGWEVTFLNARSGRLINSEAIFTYAERSIIPSIIPNKGVFILESQSIDNPLINNHITLHRYNENGLVFWRKSLLNSGLETPRLASQVTTTQTEDLLLYGTRNDSLWLLKFNPTGDLSEVATGNTNAPDLVMKISADRPDLPLYDFLTFTLIVRNEGVVAAENIRINAPFIDYQTLTATGEESISHGVFYNWTGNWDIERLEAGEEAFLTIRTFVLSDQPTFRYFSVFEQFPADFDNGNNSILLNLPYAGVVTGEEERLSLMSSATTDFQVQSEHDYIYIQLDNPQAGQVDFTLYDLQGQLVKRELVVLYKGLQQVKMGVAHLPRGIYIVQRGDTGVSQKFFVF